jgi:hypothetical protein
MNSIMIQHIIVVRTLVTILSTALLVGVLLILGGSVGAHSAHTGIMLIAPPYYLA